MRFRRNTQALLFHFIFVYSIDPDERIMARVLRLVHGPMIAVVRTRQNDWGRLEVEMHSDWLPISHRAAVEEMLVGTCRARSHHDAQSNFG